MKLRLSSSLLAIAVTLPFVALACGGDDSKPQPIAPTNTAPQPTYTAPPPTATAPPPTTTAPPPTTTAPPSGSGTGTATPLDANAASAATQALNLLAKTEAPGMTADGPAVAGTFQEGQYLESAFTLQPGKCYTLVASGIGPTHVEVEMQYTTPIPGIAPSIGTSGEKGNTATIGGKGKCLKPISPIAATAKFILRSKKGAGIAAAQLYSK